MLTGSPNKKPVGLRNRAVGSLGEFVAARLLSRKGYRIIGKNVKTFVGELDIVARKKNIIVFAEVKTRRSLVFGEPYLSVTAKKKQKLIQCAHSYLGLNNITNTPWRIDIISVELDGLKGYVKKIEHFEDAIDENDK